MRLRRTRCASNLSEKSSERVRASIVVLPFINMSSEPDNEFFSDGLTEEVINALTAVPGLQAKRKALKILHFQVI
jgi:TolB-like protein